MPRKSHRPPMRLVCRRAALIRAHFSDSSSSSNKVEQGHGKRTFIDRTGERFRLKLAKLSVGTSWMSIKKVSSIEESIQLIIIC